MHILILGLGSIGRRHAKCFKTVGAETVSGFDPSPERRTQFEAEIGGATFAGMEEALAQRPDLVLVASPNTYHARQTHAALDLGLPVFVEKPFAVNLKEGTQLAARIANEGHYLHMGSNWKFHPAFKAMKDLIQSGKLGRLTGGQVIAGGWLPDWHPYEDYRQMYTSRKSLGGGAIFDTHELDYLMWLLGPISQLKGQKLHSGALDIETEDTAAAILAFEAGPLVTLLTDYIQRVPQRRYFISGDSGSFEWNMRTSDIVVNFPGEPEAMQLSVGLEDLNDMYVAQAAHILTDIQLGRPAITPASQALAVLQAQIAWHEAAI